MVFATISLPSSYFSALKTNPTSKWIAWNKVFQEAAFKFLPWKAIVERRKSVPWFTASLHKIRQRQNRLYKQYCRNPSDPSLHACYKITRNMFRRAVRRARGLYFTRKGRNLAHGCRKGGYIWWQRAKHLCNIRNNRQTIPDLSGGVTGQSQSDKSEILCRHFAKQCTVNAPAATPVSSDVQLDADTEMFYFPLISDLDIAAAIDSLAPNKTSVDLPSNAILRCTVDVITPSLVHLFNFSLKSQTFPKAWKHAVIVPIYKNKGDPRHVNNYRPISLLPSISKIFEDISSMTLLLTYSASLFSAT